MLHFTLNCVLLVALVALLVVHFATPAETFAGGDLQYGPFEAAPTTPPMPEVQASLFSSLPPQAETNSAWTYAALFQSTCTSVGKKCQKGQQFTCVLTPHNQRRCVWS